MPNEKNQHLMIALPVLTHLLLLVLCLAGRVLGGSFWGLLAACD